MAVKASQFDSKLIDELLKDCKTPEDILGQAGLVKQLTKALLERSLNAELSTHLGYEKHGQSADSSGNARNGYTPKTLKGEQGDMEVDIPRDRDGSFSPKLVPKHQTRFEGFDDKIISMYARGMTTRDIQGLILARFCRHHLAVILY